LACVEKTFPGVEISFPAENGIFLLVETEFPAGAVQIVIIGSTFPDR
jgi:hypothetical protein